MLAWLKRSRSSGYRPRTNTGTWIPQLRTATVQPMSKESAPPPVEGAVDAVAFAKHITDFGPMGVAEMCTSIRAKRSEAAPHFGLSLSATTPASPVTVHAP